MVTLLGAVLPLVSPNNDARKIREASRQLTALFAQAQAQAARDGRPVGVGLTDSGVDTDNDGVVELSEQTGVALEAFLIAEPPPFAGFSGDSSVGIMDPNASGPYIPLTGNIPPIGPNDPPLVNLVFGHGVGGEGIDITNPADVIPPRMFRGAFIDEEDGDVEGVGDLVEIGREVFELIENDLDAEDEPDGPTEDYLGVRYLAEQKVVTARWLTWRFRSLQVAPQGGKAYRIRRRPMAEETPSRTSADAIQFPRGVGVDFDPTEGDASLSILFSPTGAIDSVYRDDDKLVSFGTIFIMLGRVENANHPNVLPNEYDEKFVEPYDFRSVSDDADGDDFLQQKRQELNLLNPESRWIAVAPSGRFVSSANQIFDPRDEEFLAGLTGDEVEQNEQQRNRQRGEAQEFAEQLRNDSAP